MPQLDAEAARAGAGSPGGQGRARRPRAGPEPSRARPSAAGRDAERRVDLGDHERPGRPAAPVLRPPRPGLNPAHSGPDLQTLPEPADSPVEGEAESRPRRNWCRTAHSSARCSVSKGLITQAQLDAALAEQARSGKPLGRVLIEHGHISETDLVRTLAEQVGLEFVDLSERAVDPSVAGLIPEHLARKYQALPVGWDDEGRLVVAMGDPSNVFAVDDIRALTGADIYTVVATAGQLQDAIDRFHRLDGEVDTMAQEAADEAMEVDDLSNVSEIIEDAPIVKFVNLLITQAVNDRASDIHVEPAEKDLRIRFRIDGVLHEVMHSPKSIQAGVISRLKVMADVNIAERRLPQDGRMSLNVGGKPVDLRVATLPTVFGEKVVMRILDKGQALLSMDDQGFLPDVLERYASFVHASPTGRSS